MYWACIQTNRQCVQQKVTIINTRQERESLLHKNCVACDTRLNYLKLVWNKNGQEVETVYYPGGIGMGNVIKGNDFFPVLTIICMHQVIQPEWRGIQVYCHTTRLPLLTSWTHLDFVC